LFPIPEPDRSARKAAIVSVISVVALVFGLLVIYARSPLPQGSSNGMGHRHGTSPYGGGTNPVDEGPTDRRSAGTPNASGPDHAVQASDDQDLAPTPDQGGEQPAPPPPPPGPSPAAPEAHTQPLDAVLATSRPGTDAPPTPIPVTVSQPENLLGSGASVAAVSPAGGRDVGGRAAAVGRFGGSEATESAVLRGLRWLKTRQDEAGHWGRHRAAVTGLGLLCFLGHGETTASPEFGDQVQKAIEWLVTNQIPGGGWPRKYEHAIATYALCEAYTMTKNKALLPIIEQATKIIIDGQNDQGGWQYSFRAGDANDTSCMAWCVQALKAGLIAGVTQNDIRTCFTKTIRAFKMNAHTDGGFGYTSPGRGGLTGAGVLSLQLMGDSKSDECQKGLDLLDGATFIWTDRGGRGAGRERTLFNKNYYWYYITQAKFNAGHERWQQWNAIFSKTLVEQQTVIPAATTDAEGRPVDIGFWKMDYSISGQTDGEEMNTCLCILQLEVYYRFLPTYIGE
jgi:hypothetical protein